MISRANIVLLALLLTFPALAAEDVDLEAVHRIRTAAFQHSQVMDLLSHLTDVNGPRLAGSPEYRAAAEWSAQRLGDWGLDDAGLESWGHYGRGWSFSRLAVHMQEPSRTPLLGYPGAWSAGTDGPVSGEVVLAPLFAPEDADDGWNLKKLAARISEYADEHRGKLRGRIVLLDPEREFEPATSPATTRLDTGDLSEVAMARVPEPVPPLEWPFDELPADRGERRRIFAHAPYEIIQDYYTRKQHILDRLNAFLRDEGAAAVLTVDGRGDGGLIFVEEIGSHESGAPIPPATIRLVPEQYNRLVRLVEKEIRVIVEVDLEATFHGDVDGQNVVAEIPGGAKRDEIVMVGGHLDSWHAGTGAADNAAGCAVAMEAVRILKSLNLEMDRTVRIALWDGEEQGLFGSRGYVRDHFGDPVTMKLKPEHQHLAAYFNLDNGSGKIRGVYLQGNDMARPIFKAWLAPFSDLGAKTITIRNTGGTDHLSFNAVGLPGFQFIQDPLDYMSRTHHSNLDVYDHLEAGDLMQASAIVAAFVYHAANRQEMLPRKPLPEPLPPMKEGAAAR